jgi:hypothetical protein
VSLSLKDLETYPSLPRRVRLETLYHHFPLSLVIPLSPEYLLSYLLTKPDKPDNAHSMRFRLRRRVSGAIQKTRHRSLTHKPQSNATFWFQCRVCRVRLQSS